MSRGGNRLPSCSKQLKMKSLFSRLKTQPAVIMAINLAMMMVIYMLMRWFFYYMNKGSFQDVTTADLLLMSWGGLRFDLSALCYLNALCILLQFLPLKCRHTPAYQRVVKYIFVAVNTIGIAVNAADIAYFEFGGRRSTATIFAEYGGESNLGTILLNSVTGYWQVWLAGIALITAVALCYYNPVKQRRPLSDLPSGAGYYVPHSIVFALALVLTLGGMRGGLGFKMHPLRQDSATIYCHNPHQAAIVLNTPFTIITTAHKKGYAEPHFFPAEQLDQIFNPVITPAETDDEDMNKLNVVVFLMESFSMEYTGFYNREPGYEGYTPFLDSLIARSHSFRYSFANGIRSVDCMPAAFAGIPRYINPYCYFMYSNNTLQGLPAMLKAEGYTTAFFHGAPNNTLGFKGFTNSIGFDSYYGMDEYGDKDFDGTWAIFDEPYLRYFADKTCDIARQGKPFFLTVFTASSHEPFTIPEQYKGTFTRGEIPMHRSISYSDFAIKQYFEKVKNEPWVNNTIFVFTADHTGVSHREDYNNEMGRFLIPIFFYTPGGQLPVGCDSTRLMQQTDITPSILSLLHYSKPYFSFGKNIFESDSTFVNYVFNDRNGLSMYYLDDLMIEYNNDKLVGIYEFRKDFSLKHNLIDKRDSYPQVPAMERQMQAILQQYVTRMKANRLTAKPDDE